MEGYNELEGLMAWTASQKGVGISSSVSMRDSGGEVAPAQTVADRCQHRRDSGLVFFNSLVAWSLAMAGLGSRADEAMARDARPPKSLAASTLRTRDSARTTEGCFALQLSAEYEVHGKGWTRASQDRVDRRGWWRSG